MLFCFEAPEKLVLLFICMGVSTVDNDWICIFGWTRPLTLQAWVKKERNVQEISTESLLAIHSVRLTKTIVCTDIFIALTVRHSIAILLMKGLFRELHYRLCAQLIGTPVWILMTHLQTGLISTVRMNRSPLSFWTRLICLPPAPSNVASQFSECTKERLNMEENQDLLDHWHQKGRVN